ncbi:lipopolysaccharide biosynthesis protein [Victivallis sp. Marseille-Q1083]|uniref:lipopolysaccharide biosynthesis protein n=1 Tax=Victivallis sp. Marseille-Q1083 TaxID=2717288 RepID=UPI00158945F3|nr:oligosaccharide flippase family protein [Victivallis sp. Marseille-Q1083]
MPSASKLVVNSVLYSFSGILSKCLGFFLLPVYTFYLSPADYGIINLLLSFVSMCSYFVLLSLDSGLMRYFAEYRDQPQTLRRLYGSLILVVFSCYLLFVIILILFRDWFDETFFKGIAFLPYVVISLLILGGSATFTLHRRYLEASQQGKKLVSISVFATFLTAGTALSFLALFHWGAKGMLLATLTSEGFYLCYMFFDIIRNKLAVFCFDMKLIKECLAYSLPIIPHNMSGYIGNFLSRLFLKNADSLASLGIFSVALQIASALETVQDSCGHAYRPWLNETLKNRASDMKQKISDISKLLICCYCILYLGVAVFSMEIIVIMVSPAFWGAWKIVVAMTMVYSFYSLYYFYIYQAFYYKETARKIFIVSIMGSIVMILVTYFSVPYLGIWGNVAGMFVSINIRWLGIRLLLRNMEKIGYNIKYLLSSILSSCFFIILGIIPAFLLEFRGICFYYIVYKCAIIGVFVLGLYFVNRKFFETIGLKNLIWNYLSKKLHVFRMKGA